MNPNLEDDQPPRAYIPLPRMPLWGFIWRSALFMASGLGAVWIGYWYDQALGVACGLAGCFAWMLPWMGWREYHDRKEVTVRCNELLDSHNIATAGYLELRLSGARDTSARQIRDQQVELAALRDERDSLTKLLGGAGVLRDPKTGRMVSARRVLQIEAQAAKMPRVQPLIEGSTDEGDRL